MNKNVKIALILALYLLVVILFVLIRVLPNGSTLKILK